MPWDGQEARKYGKTTMYIRECVSKNFSMFEEKRKIFTIKLVSALSPDFAYVLHPCSLRKYPKFRSMRLRAFHLVEHSQSPDSYTQPWELGICCSWPVLSCRIRIKCYYVYDLSHGLYYSTFGFVVAFLTTKGCCLCWFQEYWIFCCQQDWECIRVLKYRHNHFKNRIYELIFSGSQKFRSEVHMLTLTIQGLFLADHQVGLYWIN